MENHSWSKILKAQFSPFTVSKVKFQVTDITGLQHSNQRLRTLLFSSKFTHLDFLVTFEVWSILHAMWKLLGPSAEPVSPNGACSLDRWSNNVYYPLKDNIFNCCEMHTCRISHFSLKLAQDNWKEESSQRELKVAILVASLPIADVTCGSNNDAGGISSVPEWEGATRNCIALGFRRWNLNYCCFLYRITIQKTGKNLLEIVLSLS